MPASFARASMAASASKPGDLTADIHVMTFCPQTGFRHLTKRMHERTRRSAERRPLHAAQHPVLRFHSGKRHDIQDCTSPPGARSCFSFRPARMGCSPFFTAWSTMS